MLFENDDVVSQNIINSLMVKELEKQYGMKAVKAYKYCNTSYGTFSIEVKLVEISEEKNRFWQKSKESKLDKSLLQRKNYKLRRYLSL